MASNVPTRPPPPAPFVASSSSLSPSFQAISLRRFALSVSGNSRSVTKRVMGSSPSSMNNRTQGGTLDYSTLSDDEWKKRLCEQQYYVTRKKGTERVFTGEYWNTKTPGTYHCICCDTPLFDSRTKFDSGTGWPSYYEPVGDNVKSKLDMSIIFMPRQEALCAKCDAHLGHVFDDCPQPTGKRYCINRSALPFSRICHVCQQCIFLCFKRRKHKTVS